MTYPRMLHLEPEGGRSLPVEIRKETRERSLHSGRDLVELHGVAIAEGAEAHHAATELLKTLVDRSVIAHDEAGEFAGKWCISWNSYGESGEVHSYTLLLREAEELSLDALLLEDQEIHPYEYREDVVGDGLALWIKAVASDTDIHRLRALVRSRPTFSVVRRGISDEPREMRIGTAEWSQVEDLTKFRLVLVDRSLDGKARPELARIEEENTRAALGFYANFLERLADLMVEKGVLAREEVAQLRENARSSPGVPRHDMWRVADIDEL